MIQSLRLIIALIVALSQCQWVSADIITDFGNVVFIGDSISEGSSIRPNGDGNYSWRYSFWKKMIDEGVSFEFVGSRISNYQGNSAYPNYMGYVFENRHESIWGTTSAERSITLAPYFNDLNRDGSNKTADTAFILLGTNDIFASTSPLDVRDNIQVLVNGLQNANDTVSVYLISIPPYFDTDTNGDGFPDHPWSGNSRFNDVNSLLKANCARSSSMLLF